MQPTNNWLPTSKKEAEERGWDEPDVILFSADAYIDHPSFGTAIIGRLLEKEGLRVAIVPQPNWRDDLRNFKKLGKPRLFFGISSGCMDPMINHYTANKRLRSDDAYSPGGKTGFRPDYATTVYATILKKLFPDTPVVIGGIEGSMRRFTHYDYWKDCLLPGILIDSKADLLVYGMGEKAILQVVRELREGKNFSSLVDIPQTAYLQNKKEAFPSHEQWKVKQLFSHEKCLNDKIAFAENFKMIEHESNTHSNSRLVQEYQDKLIVVNPPYPPLSEEEIDSIYDLPFTRVPHPRYHKKATIPAYEMIRHSATIHRGCFGGCSFCTISAHQGKFISSRSINSILREIDQIKKMEDFKGYISDLGGPSANMYRMKGKNETICHSCHKPSCIFPSICSNLDTSHEVLTGLYKRAANTEGIKKVTIGSGIRYDLLVKEYNPGFNKGHEQYLEQLITHHVSGRLKVAPEHTSDKVLEVMRKPSYRFFEAFKKLFRQINQKKGLNQQLIPYFISSHPGCSEEDMAELAVITKNDGFKLEQVQDFTPSPMTLASVMFYTGINPYSGKKIVVSKTKEEKQAQHLFFFWYKKEFRDRIVKRLHQLKRSDLVKKLFG